MSALVVESDQGIVANLDGAKCIKTGPAEAPKFVAKWHTAKCQKKFMLQNVKKKIYIENVKKMLC